MERLARTLALALPLAAAPATALAAAPGQAGGQVQVGTSGSSTGGGFSWPERIIGGNAISLVSPLQLGLVGFVPRARIGVQYDRQIDVPHWVHVGIAGLFDRGDWETFGQQTCGFDPMEAPDACGSGTVAGFDIWAGYAYKFYLKEYPFLVPFVRGSLGGGFWKYPKIGGSRLQSVDWAGSGSLRLGGGVRLFLTRSLALGLDLGLALGFTRSRETTLAGEPEMVARFLLALELLPVIVEYRF